ncbi:MAG: alpha-amylase [Oscillospiraceae bacterium]|nr:alpha-amylase [Oscillospiraceae bacterium]
MSVIERARELRKQIEENASVLTDEKAAEVPELFPAWNGDGVSFITGNRVRYNGVLYKCLQSHETQANWTPETAPSLWARVLIEDPDTVSAWVQPDSTNPYMIGDKVSHNGKTWECSVNYNVWEPGVYGWTEVTE